MVSWSRQLVRDRIALRSGRPVERKRRPRQAPVIGPMPQGPLAAHCVECRGLIPAWMRNLPGICIECAFIRCARCGCRHGRLAHGVRQLRVLDNEGTPR